MTTTTTTTAAALLALAGLALGAPSSAGVGSASGGASSAPALTVVTAVASASTLPVASALPAQAPLAPHQAWCPSSIFCAGEVLQTINLAQLFTDPKTIVDKPTSKPAQQVLSAFNASVGAHPTEGSVLAFEDSNFSGEGLELAAVALPTFNESPSFLGNVSNPLVRAWAQTVHGYWTSLIRNTNQSVLCTGGKCESSLIPLNHTFVVPGGRFREQYYWDSYWIVEGLLQSQLYDIANGTLQNFMDEIERFGFIPNGGRIYYLNRSQPPLFTAMLSNYVNATRDTGILKRALPIAERELEWWTANRMLNVTSPGSNASHTLAHYSVTNTAPRPESYYQDYMTANDPTLPTLSESQKEDLYGQLASGAETGWDYSSRWMEDPTLPGNAALRTLRVKSIVPVCLNSILYKAHTLLAGFYHAYPQYSATPANASASASAHATRASELQTAILDVFWSPSKLAFYDFILDNSTSALAASPGSSRTGTPSSLWSAATFYPFWVGIVPSQVASNASAAFGAFSALNLVLSRYNGTIPVTFLETGQQWDAPNAWPPHQYIALQALRNLPANVTGAALPTPPAGQGSFALVPAGQLNVAEGALPAQQLSVSANASASGAAADVNALNGTVANGGNATQGEGWADRLQRELANRYIASALCSWHATGGSVPNLLPRLSDAELNVTQSQNLTGIMFEKFSVQDIDSAGRGGEYTVQAGFGWTNGVALWVAAQYGHQLATPSCPDLLASAEAADNGASSAAGGASASASGSMSAGASGSGSATAIAPGSASGTMSSSGTAASPSSTGKNAGARTAAGGGLALLVGVLAAVAIAA